MPAAQRLVRCRNKGYWKFREKNKLKRLVGLLVCGLLLLVTIDAALKTFNCVKQCSAHRSSAGFYLDKTGIEAPVLENRGLQPYLIFVGPPPEVTSRYVWIKNNIKPMKRNLAYNTQPTEYGIDWHDDAADADPTKKWSIMIFNGLSKFVGRILHDFALYKDQDARDYLSPDDISFNHKAMFDSVVFVTSF